MTSEARAIVLPPGTRAALVRFREAAAQRAAVLTSGEGPPGTAGLVEHRKQVVAGLRFTLGRDPDAGEIERAFQEGIDFARTNSPELAAVRSVTQHVDALLNGFAEGNAPAQSVKCAAAYGASVLLGSLIDQLLEHDGSEFASRAVPVVSRLQGALEEAKETHGENADVFLTAGE